MICTHCGLRHPSERCNRVEGRRERVGEVARGWTWNPPGRGAPSKGQVGRIAKALADIRKGG